MLRASERCSDTLSHAKRRLRYANYVGYATGGHSSPGLKAWGFLAVFIKARLWDLMVPFQKGHYIHPDMHGSYSLKKVLPALVSSMSYQDMSISDGGEASKAYFDAMCGRLTGSAKEKVFANLRRYCAYDTLATVEILKILLKDA